jgi:hypothetical protein
MARVVKPDQVKTLRDWVTRWPKAGNLGFDAETREPVIYSADKDRKRVSTIPWRREADTLTVLTQPSAFSAQTVEAAKSRYGRIQEQRVQVTAAAEEQLRIAEAGVLEAWRNYNAAPAATKSVLRHDVLAAEKTLVDMEKLLASQLYKERAIRTIEEYKLPYTPPMPVMRRGIALATALGGAGGGVSESKGSD